MGVVVRNPKICANGDTAHPIAVQTPPVHSGLFGVIVPWISGLSYKVLESIIHLALFLYLA